VHASIARGRIITVDTAPARAVDGVIAVLTHENSPAMKPPPKLHMANSTSVNYLATVEVHWNGQPVAVMVADTPETARYAASLVRPVYEQWPAAVDLVRVCDLPITLGKLL
jgi:xanthine dehydrogenase YagR molybdenum-binding subunit